jgi:zinc protease
MNRLALWFLPLALPAADYVVIVSQKTAEAPGWSAVVQSLEKTRQAKVLRFEGSVLSMQSKLRTESPRWVCWVAQPEELGVKAAVDMHQLARDNDEDPYEDFQWGVITGRTSDDAQKLTDNSKPLIIRTVGASTNFASECVEEGYWFDEFTAGEKWTKSKGGIAEKLSGAKDSTESIVQKLNEGKTDLFITSGHATENDWQPGYKYRNGDFRHKDGTIIGKALDGKVHVVDSPNPKVYLPIGNCLMGNIPSKNCMALAWMHSCGVKQMIGYVVPTWFGYAGWGVLDYFVEQPGRFTLNQAWLANHHALIWKKLHKADNAQDLTGLEFDVDKTIFYGDPQWEARMAPGALRWEESLKQISAREWEWTITPKAGVKTFAAVNTNGSQRGGRPLVAFLPRHAAGWTLLTGKEWNPVLADDFILLPKPGTDTELPKAIVIRIQAK